jgi:hypothetical protein
MKNNLLASIALFGIYRNTNQDTYDLVAQYISAVIAQKEYERFKTDTIQSDLKELFQIDIPIGVINSVCKNRIEGLSLSKGVFTCSRIPKDEIEKEYAELTANYDDLFTLLIAFVNKETTEYDGQTIKSRFSDFLIDGGIPETKLNNLFAAFIAGNQESKDIRQKIDLLSSGLISYNGLSYTDSAGNSGAWTEKLTIYLDTEFLFSCAGYNDPYLHDVFQELYELVKEINISYRRRTKKLDNLVELKYLKDTREVYLSLFNSAKGYIDSKGAPDPSKRALVKIISESTTVFDVDTHRARIDTAIKDIYNIQYDDRDYSNFITDRRYIIFDESTVTSLSHDYNPKKDDTTSRKIDYYARVYTIINGLRGGVRVNIFEKCRYIFLTGSRIGRGASMAARPDTKSVTLATDIDFLVSRFWFKLNKQLTNNHIPVSLDIVARSQAVLTKEVSRKVKALYEELKLKNISELEQKSLYANLTEAEKYLAPNSITSTESVLAFIDYKDVDALIEDQRNLRMKVAEAEKRERELTDAKSKLSQKENEIEGLKKDLAENYKDHQQKQSDVSKENTRLTRINKWLIGAIVLLAVIIIAMALVLILR